MNEIKYYNTHKIVPNDVSSTLSREDIDIENNIPPIYINIILSTFCVILLMFLSFILPLLIYASEDRYRIEFINFICEDATEKCNNSKCFENVFIECKTINCYVEKTNICIATKNCVNFDINCSIDMRELVLSKWRNVKDNKIKSYNEKILSILRLDTMYNNIGKKIDHDVTIYIFGAIGLLISVSILIYYN